MTKSKLEEYSNWSVIGTWILIVGASILAVNNVQINADANYYLPIAREILQGHTPTYSVNSGYTPFVMYIYAGLFSIIDSFVAVLYLNLFVHLLNSILLGWIIKKESKTPQLSWILGGVYYFVTLGLDGFYVVLEPFQILFALFALIAVVQVKRAYFNHFLPGLFLGISLMCKQYSALFVVAFGLYFLVENFKSKQPWRLFFFNLGSYGLGVMLPFFCFILFTKAELIHSLRSFGFIGSLVTNYAESNSLTAIQRVVGFFYIAISKFYLFLPFFVYPFLRWKRKSIMLYDVSWLAGVLIMPIFFIRSFPHYFQLFPPWGLILITYFVPSLIDLIKRKEFVRFRPVYGFLVFVSIVTVGFSALHSAKTGLYFLLRNPRKQQVVENQFVNSVFPKGSEVYVIPGGWYYYDCEFTNPLGEYGFNLFMDFIEREDVSLDGVSKIVVKAIFNEKVNLQIENALKNRGYKRIEVGDKGEKYLVSFYVKQE